MVDEKVIFFCSAADSASGYIYFTGHYTQEYECNDLMVTNSISTAKGGIWWHYKKYDCWTTRQLDYSNVPVERVLMHSCR